MSERVADKRTFAAVVVVIAATYGYFLLFAEFAFIELLREARGAEGLRGAMGVLGAAGVVGSLAAAQFFRRDAWARGLRWGSIACTAAALLARWQAGVPAAVGIGFALGRMTVTLAEGLRAAVGLRTLGRAVGLGTGCAYALCNVPWVFHAEPRVQAWCAAGMMVLAAGVTGVLGRRAAGDVSEERDFWGAWTVGWTTIFLALVWMDSAVFYIIQHTPAFRAAIWSENGSLVVNAGVHLLGAMLAGAMLDRGWLGRVAAAAWVALAVACLLLTRKAAGAGVLYAMGVSLYSVALVYYPACGGRPWVVGIVFAVSGWVGSALGIGMAQDLNAVPAWFVAAAGAVVAGVLLARQRARRSWRTLVLVGAGSLTFSATDGRAEDLVARGREVYVGEGCIHCHSQFVRPGTMDVTWWGPEKPLAESRAEAPPLLGNRRQGPDLAQVGNRRSPEWNRLHLIAPRAVSPGSRMPSYAHLFEQGDGRGEALVAYLASLGTETAEARAAQVAGWKPADEGREAMNGARLFAALCVNCHGGGGRGDGVLAAKLSVRPPDWTAGEWRRAKADDEEAVARIIKFGLLGSPMAGHEYLRDEEVVSLARHARSLHGERVAP